MIIELRQYVPSPGKADELYERLRTESFAIFKQVGIRVQSMWLAPDTGDIWYTVEWQSREEMQQGWIAFRNSADWIRVKAQTESDGPLMASMSSHVLVEQPINSAK